MTDQPALFQLEPASPPASACLVSETADTVSHMPDKRSTRRLVTLAQRLQAAEQPLDRARLAAEIRDLADQLVASNITDANTAGLTWRQIGAELGVPFQTLYRRYGGQG